MKVKIPFTKVGKKYLITVEALEEYLRGTRNPEGEKKPAEELPKEKTDWRIT